MRFAAKLRTGALAGLVTLCLTTIAASALTISGAGATFPYPVYAQWAVTYRSATGNTVNYQSIGSGGGIKQIEQKTVAFGATDAPLLPAELNRWGLLQFPTLIGGVVPVINVPGIAPGQLVLDGPTLGDIFLGKITKWNDPAIKRLNPALMLPNQAIAPVHRSDGSGTTFLFTNYLGKVSKAWLDQVGAATAVEWPVGLGAKGNEGVAQNVRQTAGSIGYVEYAYAKQNRLTHTAMLNRDGKAVQPSLISFTAAASGVTWDPAQGFGTILTQQPGAQSWPIAGATFVLVHKQPAKPAETAEALKFFQWAYKNGDQAASALGYVPLPDSLTQRVEASWAQVQGARTAK
jgi:phosphate transport system substrate-binding protein